MGIVNKIFMQLKVMQKLQSQITTIRFICDN